MNIKFPKLSVPRLVGLRFNIIGHPVPPRTRKDSSAPGRYLDVLTKSLLGQSTSTRIGVDNQHLMLETKSKDIHSNTDWTVGNMTLEDIVNTPYTNSSLYEKMQAWWVIRYDNELQIVCNSNIYYFDNDDVQARIQYGYETARKKVISFYNSQREINDKKYNESLFIFGDDFKKIKFDKSHQFKGAPGYRMEYSNEGASIKFRISQAEMNRLTRLAIFEANKNLEF